MNQPLLERLKVLKKEIHCLLCNKLTYPKVVVGILRDRALSEDELLRMQEVIDESIVVVDAKFSELIDEIESV